MKPGDKVSVTFPIDLEFAQKDPHYAGRTVEGTIAEVTGKDRSLLVIRLVTGRSYWYGAKAEADGVKIEAVQEES